MEYEYKCKCGHTFVEDLGKYGCPNCEGENPVKLIEMTLPVGLKEKIILLDSKIEDAHKNRAYHLILRTKDTVEIRNLLHILSNQPKDLE